MEFPLYESVVRLLVAAVSGFLFFAVYLGYRRRPGTRMGLVLLAFGLFLVQGVVLAYETLVRDTPLTETAYFTLQLLALVTLAVAVVAR